MTGYGRGEVTTPGVRVAVEVQSVNRKQLDIHVLLPREFATLDAPIRSLIAGGISRGRLNVAIDITIPDTEQRLTIDHALAAQYRSAIDALKCSLNLEGTPDLETILKAPGVIRLHEASLPADEALPSVVRAVEAALVELDKMRLREGRHLAKDLIQRLKTVRQKIRKIRQLHPGVLLRYRNNLQERIASAGFAVDATDERLLKELAFFADRCDISEELTRLESHLAQIAHQLRGSEPAGRPLDFLTQEIQRELNTLGAKANDADIAQCVVACKSEMEKIREQIQNIE